MYTLYRHSCGQNGKVVLRACQRGHFHLDLNSPNRGICQHSIYQKVEEPVFLHITTFKYSLHEFRETIDKLPYKLLKGPAFWYRYTLYIYGLLLALPLYNSISKSFCGRSIQFSASGSYNAVAARVIIYSMQPKYALNTIRCDM